MFDVNDGMESGYASQYWAYLMSDTILFSQMVVSRK